jgi:hypothetical protein
MKHGNQYADDAIKVWGRRGNCHRTGQPLFVCVSHRVWNPVGQKCAHVASGAK